LSDKEMQGIRDAIAKKYPELADEMQREDYRILIHGDNTVTHLIRGQTTHGGIRTKTIHMAGGEYAYLRTKEKEYGKPYLAARIAHEVFEISKWRETARVRRYDPDSDTMRNWIQTNLDQAKVLDEHYHESGELIENFMINEYPDKPRPNLKDPADINIANGFTPAPKTNIGQSFFQWLKTIFSKLKNRLHAFSPSGRREMVQRNVTRVQEARTAQMNVGGRPQHDSSVLDSTLEDPTLKSRANVIRRALESAA
jgi:hypothetical protein